MSVEFFKDGSALALQTDCATEGLFVEQFCEILDQMIEKEAHKDEWEFHLREWLPQFVEICNAYRGYKTKVLTKTVYTTGDLAPGACLHTGDEFGIVTNMHTAQVTVSDKIQVLHEDPTP